MNVLGVALIAVLAAGCGDNSKSCGEGTDDSDGDGECESLVPPGGKVCGDGTIVDPITSLCVPDPETCGGGTVLVNGSCQDPAAGLDIDLEEGPEPNAFETGAVPAGVIALEPVGSDGFVVHGCIKPVDDATPDLDVYLLSVTAPTLVEVTADGVAGLAAGFQVTSSEAVLATWKRFGVNVATDTSKRQVLLPAAGAYRLIVTDSRTLLPQLTGGATSPPAGNPDGSSCYYVTLARQTPAPVGLVIASGDTGTIDDKLRVYTAAVPTGIVRLTATFQTAHAQESIVVLRNGALHAFDDDGSITFSGFASGDDALIVTDFVYNYALFSVPYTLTSP
ncbi:MAG: hypothetical protein M4D80_10730 [Myxococcota bacterium]|nr:hypothetical protein [Deltaproteobacteria bacterium]MDQ3335631.1 hypothetical protein [Myxococcota bacterium]